MNIRRCENGHFYDGDNYGKCPLCLSDNESMNLPEKFRKLGSLSRLDKGSTSRVYRIDSEPYLVLKVINCGSDKNKYNNALYEKRIMDTIKQSDRVVPVLDFDVEEYPNGEATIFILEKYCTPLEQVVSMKKLSEKELLKIAIDLCEAVQEVISHGVFHLDLKPKNIYLFDENKVILGDFGSSLLAGDLARNQSARGTLEYMAPEVYQEHYCNECSEIYSIGLIVYYLLNERKLPFVEDVNNSKQRELATYKRLAGTELPLISVGSPFSGAEDEINSLIKNTCAYKTENRIKSISDLNSRLLKILQQIEDSTESATMNKTVPKKVLPIIFMIDTSGSMSGVRIAELNDAMRDLINILREKDSEMPECEIKIGVLKYSSGCEWITNGLIGIHKFQWKDLTAGGMTGFGSAIHKLNKALSRKNFLNNTAGYYIPYIINVSDGAPSDDWERAFEIIKDNKWFDASKKICVAIGDDADCTILEKFCGTKEAVIRADDISLLRILIADISISASKMSCFSKDVNKTTALFRNDWNDESWNVDSVAASMMVQNTLSSINSDVETTSGQGQSKEPECLYSINDSDCDNNECCDDSWDVEPIATSVAISTDDNDEASKRRKALADSLRKGEPVAISPEGEIANLSTADAIAALRAQLAGGEAIVNADGTVFNPYDSLAQGSRGDSIKPIDKAVVAGGNISDWDSIQVPDGKLAGGYGMCRICGDVFNQITKYCPKCGTKVVIEKSAVQLSQVEFSAIAPKRLVKGEYSIIDIVMYEEAYRYIVDEIHHKADDETQEDRKGKFEVKKSAKIKVVLTSTDIKIEDNEMSGVWQGSYLNFSFPVYLPDDFHKKQVLFIAKVYVNDIILTKLTLTARCSSLFEQKINIKREDVLTAFVSYASQDRKKVATIVQGMKKARPDMDLFFDVESLRSGDSWEKTLYREIEKRDILYLCWSHYAKNSEWVDKEWRYAYSQKGIDGIEPMPIELPEDCPPPQELSGKHWNDQLLYVIDHLNKKMTEEQALDDKFDWDNIDIW